MHRLIIFSLALTPSTISLAKAFPLNLDTSGLRNNSQKTVPINDMSPLFLSPKNRDSRRKGRFESSKVPVRLSKSAAEASGNEDASSDKVMTGRALLLLVAVLYGTLNVSLRLIYQLPESIAPSAAALSTARGWFATAGFIPLLIWKAPPQQTQSTKSSAISIESSKTKSHSPEGSLSLSKFGPLFVAGLELAVWNMLAQGLLNVGLLSTTSARASFLTQTSVVLTPVISYLSGDIIRPTVWAACGLALAGLTVLAGGGFPFGNIATGMDISLFNQGDLLVLGGALSWSLYLFRLSKIGSKFDDIQLQFVKTTLLAVLYSSWLVISMVASPENTTTSPFGWLISGAALMTLIYSAFGPGTIADILQQQGQKYVSASEANIILSLEPICAALSAWLIMGEITSASEMVGGGIILFAALLTTL